uniref:ApcA1 n=1 Tax=Acaryochloris sp. HICR111A TaxID=576912 RepID=E3T819_9CYAN|nr:ApcA1 [Acaryochloris sp. HICR111A]
MFSQFSRLIVEADGRYATDAELAFVKSYLNSAKQRIDAYESIREAEELIMDKAEECLEAQDPQVFMKGTREVRDICRRDRKSTLRYSAAAMLFNDLDRLKDSLLLWQRTIVHAVKDEQVSQQTWAVMPEVLREYVDAESVDLMMPALHLTQALLN